MFKSKLVITGIGILVILLIFSMAIPALEMHNKTAKLEQTFAEQFRIFTPTLDQLTGSGVPDTRNHCLDTTHSHTQTVAYCSSFAMYRYNSVPTAASDRTKVGVSAQKLDNLLVQSSWTADRRQDAIKTVAAAIPVAPLAAFHVIQVPFHKNIGAISCNLVVEFSGPTDGNSPGAINVSMFSCQQHISYFSLHFRTFYNRIFG